jgi:hypothetical protein
MDTKLLRLSTEKETTLTNKVNVPSTGGVNTSREGCGALDVADTLGPIFRMLILRLCHTITASVRVVLENY